MVIRRAGIVDDKIFCAEIICDGAGNGGIGNVVRREIGLNFSAGNRDGLADQILERRGQVRERLAEEAELQHRAKQTTRLFDGRADEGSILLVSNGQGAASEEIWASQNRANDVRANRNLMAAIVPAGFL